MSFPILPAIAGVFGVVNTLFQTQSRMAQAKSAAAVNEYNATRKKEQANIARLEATRKEENFRRQSQKELGKQRAKLAQGGILDSPTGKSLMDQSANQAELDALNIGYQGDLAARGLLSDANLTEYQAQENRKKADNIGLSAGLGLGTNLLTKIN